MMEFVRKCCLIDVVKGTTKLCCICLNDITDVSFSLYDEVTLCCESNIEISEILALILGDECLQNFSTSLLCAKCVETSIQFYEFTKMCRQNTTQLGNMVTGLNECLDKTKKELHSYKTIYLTVNEKTYDAQVYYDVEAPSSDTKAAALTRLKFVSCSESEYYKEEVFECDNNIEEPKYGGPKIHKQKLRNRIKKSTSIMLESEEVLSLKCKDCHREYTTLYNLKRHYVRVHAPKDFKCTECNRCFGSHAILNQHKYESHASVVCIECGKAFTNRKTLVLHELSHTLKLVCQTCGKIFSRKKNFHNHILTKCGPQQKSQTKSMYICDYCNKKYTCKSTLRSHIQLEHIGGHHHVCLWCSKKFSSLSRLKAHCVTHTQEKNFSCDICGNLFVSKESLLYHTRTHTGEKPFQCDFCDQRFLSSSRRAEHTRRLHMKPQLECDICHRKFKMRTCLLRHKKRHYDPTSRLHYTRVTENDQQM